MNPGCLYVGCGMAIILTTQLHRDRQMGFLSQSIDIVITYDLRTVHLEAEMSICCSHLQLNKRDEADETHLVQT